MGVYFYISCVLGDLLFLYAVVIVNCCDYMLCFVSIFLVCEFIH